MTDKKPINKLILDDAYASPKYSNRKNTRASSEQA